MVKIIEKTLKKIFKKINILKKCSIKNVLIVLCLLILLYLIYDTYVLKENMGVAAAAAASKGAAAAASKGVMAADHNEFETLASIFRGGNQEGINMSSMCKHIDKIKSLCNQCQHGERAILENVENNNINFCFPPDIENNCDYKGLYGYGDEYDHDYIGKYFATTKWEDISSNGRYKCNNYLKYGPAVRGKINLKCSAPLENATLTGCDVLTLKYTEHVDDKTINSGDDKSKIFKDIEEWDTLLENKPEISGREKYFFTTKDHPTKVYTIEIDISNTEISNITKINYNAQDISAINIEDIESVDELSTSTSTPLFLYKIKTGSIACNFYTRVINGSNDITLTAINLAKRSLPSIAPPSIDITFNTNDKIYLFKNPP